MACLYFDFGYPENLLIIFTACNFYQPMMKEKGMQTGNIVDRKHCLP